MIQEKRGSAGARVVNGASMREFPVCSHGDGTCCLLEALCGLQAALVLGSGKALQVEMPLFLHAKVGQGPACTCMEGYRVSHLLDYVSKVPSSS